MFPWPVLRSSFTTGAAVQLHYCAGVQSGFGFDTLNRNRTIARCAWLIRPQRTEKGFVTLGAFVLNALLVLSARVVR